MIYSDKEKGLRFTASHELAVRTLCKYLKCDEDQFIATILTLFGKGIKKKGDKQTV